MRYMLMVCGDESDHEKSPEEMRKDHEGFAWYEEMNRRGVLRGGNRLRPGSDATTVRVRDDEVLHLRRALRRDKGTDGRLRPDRVR